MASRPRATDMFVKPDDLPAFVTAILKALKVSNRTEAVIAVAELGWKLPLVRR